MEIADLFVVNKKEVRGAERFAMDLESVLEMQSGEHRPGVLMTSANSGEGVPELVDWLEEYYETARRNGRLEERRAGQRIERIKRSAELAVARRLWQVITPASLDKLVNSDMPVRNAAHQLIKQFFSGKAGG